MELTELRTFVAVVAAGSFTGAARALGTDKARVSRVIARLEERLGARLLQRSSRRLAVTEIGRELLRRAKDVLAAVDEAEAVVASARAVPGGTLKLAAGIEFGRLRVNGWIDALLERHPDVRVDADYSNRIVDLIHEGIDVSIRIGEQADSELAARRLGALEYRLCASPSYLAARGTPRTVEELDAHARLVVTQDGSSRWTLRDGDARRTVDTEARVTANSHFAVHDLALRGHGIAQLPTIQVAADLRTGHLVAVLPGRAREPAPVYAVFPSSRYLAPSVRAFVDVAIERFDAEDTGRTG